MYPAEFEYFSPRTIDEALALLSTWGEDAKILSGGQSLVPMMKLRIASPRCLIDINRIDSLSGLRVDEGRLVMGALCRHADVAASALVREHLPLMLDAVSQTADVQVRNRGTVAGSLAHADPAGDWPAALLALDTHLTVVSPRGQRTVALETFLVDAYTTDLAVDEIVTEVAVSLPRPPAGGAYVKFEKRAGDFAVASVGVQLTLEGDRCSDVAISLGALGAIPSRASAAEAELRDQPVTDERLDRAADLVREAAQPFEDTRGSVEYKRHLAGVLFTRAFAVAADRARGSRVSTLHL
ncbi:MAG: xanthine dehydrogenase family protein subunit M [Acidobacteria bacterium]|nr:xanthine dehydrogenase family protein subunit M [Acidobacteriota bacterium]